MTLDDIKLGDEVAIMAASVWSRGEPIKSTVSRTTATQVVVNYQGMRFSRRNGFGVGSVATRWRIEMWGEQHDKAVAVAVEDAYRSRILGAMEDRGKTRRLTLDQLRRIAAILEEPTP